MSGRSDWMTLATRIPKQLMEDIDAWVGKDMRDDFIIRALESQLRQERMKTGIPPVAMTLLELGQDALEAGDRRSARRYFTQAVRLCPKFAEGFNQIGAMEYESRHYEKAREFFVKALTIATEPLGDLRRRDGWWLDPVTRPYMRAKFNLALTLHRLGNSVQSKALFLELLRLDPNDHQGARFPLADVMKSLGESVPDDLDRLIGQALGNAEADSVEWADEREVESVDDQGGGLIH